MVQLLGALRELRPSNEEREYLQAAVASGGDEGGVHVAMPAVLQVEHSGPDAAGDGASASPSDGSGSGSKGAGLVQDTSSWGVAQQSCSAGRQRCGLRGTSHCSWGCRRRGRVSSVGR